MVLHWVVALLLATALVLEWTLPRRAAPGYDDWLSLHKSIGLTVLALAFARLGWRLAHPVMPARGLTPLEAGLSRLTHLALYAILFLIPVSGYLFSSWEGQGVTIFGMEHVNSPFSIDRGLAQPWELIHRVGQYLVYAVVGLHVVAAIYHYVFRRDQVLQRMLPAAWSAWLGR